jgi:predicted phage tail protein
MVKVTLHGKLGEDIGSEWDLDIHSVQEAFRAIEANTRKLKKWMFNEGSQYSICIFINKKPISLKDKDSIKSSEIFCIFGNQLKTIDIIPEIEGSITLPSWAQPYVGAATTILGGAAAIAGGVYLDNDFSPFLVNAGLSLIAAGVTNLLSKPPPNVPYQAQQATTATQGAIGQNGGPQSYLFNGPVNIAGEGGPVPVGYGQLMVGSNAVNVFYENIYVANKRSVFTNPTDPTFLQDTFEGYQFPFNEQMMLVSQKAGYNV